MADAVSIVIRDHERVKSSFPVRLLRAALIRPKISGNVVNAPGMQSLVGKIHIFLAVMNSVFARLNYLKFLLFFSLFLIFLFFFFCNRVRSLGNPTKRIEIDSVFLINSAATKGENNLEPFRSLSRARRALSRRSTKHRTRVNKR